ncbi:MAG: hypothetical protein NTX86_05815 [Candidatus Dependentiae bacterium]|nr:hypothetical protein [Candidatus Dependentiae bacterium]
MKIKHTLTYSLALLATVLIAGQCQAMNQLEFAKAERALNKKIDSFLALEDAEKADPIAASAANDIATLKAKVAKNPVQLRKVKALETTFERIKATAELVVRSTPIIMKEINRQFEQLGSGCKKETESIIEQAKKAIDKAIDDGNKETNEGNKTIRELIARTNNDSRFISFLIEKLQATTGKGYEDYEKEFNEPSSAGSSTSAAQ